MAHAFAQKVLAMRGDRAKYIDDAADDDTEDDSLSLATIVRKANDVVLDGTSAPSDSSPNAGTYVSFSRCHYYGVCKNYHSWTSA